MDWVPLPEDLAGVGLMDAGEGPRENRLARSVIPDESGYLARRQVEVDVVERPYRPEVLLDAANFEQRFARRRSALGRQPVTRHGVGHVGVDHVVSPHRVSGTTSWPHSTPPRSGAAA